MLANVPFVLKLSFDTDSGLSLSEVAILIDNTDCSLSPATTSAGVCFNVTLSKVIFCGVYSSTTAANPGFGSPVVLLRYTVRAPSAAEDFRVRGVGFFSNVAIRLSLAMFLPLYIFSMSFRPMVEVLNSCSEEKVTFIFLPALVGANVTRPSKF